MTSNSWQDIDGEKPRRPQPMQPIGWRVAVLALVMIAVAFLFSYLWLSAPIPEYETNDAAMQLELGKLQAEARRNALAAAGGMAALGALMLGFRRQRHVEHQQLYREYEFAYTLSVADRDHQHRERTAIASEEDALQRRITDMRVKAIEQLGSEKAAVRIGGLHNLERLGEHHPDLRQTVLDEICAYLQQPYTRPEETEDSTAVQERRVRSEAQRILKRHLQLEDALAYEFWEHERIDLSHAILENLDFIGCDLWNASFKGARFYGVTWFTVADFHDFSSFERAEFHGAVAFDEARFNSTVRFDRSTFHAPANFRLAEFFRWSSMNKTSFESEVDLSDAHFADDISIPGTSAQANQWYSGARFRRDARIGTDTLRLVQIDDEPNWYRCEPLPLDRSLDREGVSGNTLPLQAENAAMVVELASEDQAVEAAEPDDGGSSKLVGVKVLGFFRLRRSGCVAAGRLGCGSQASRATVLMTRLVPLSRRWSARCARTPGSAATGSPRWRPGVPARAVRSRRSGCRTGAAGRAACVRSGTGAGQGQQIEQVFLSRRLALQRPALTTAALREFLAVPGAAAWQPASDG